MADNVTLFDELRERRPTARVEPVSLRDGVEDETDGAEKGKGEQNRAAYGFFRGIGDRALHLEFQRLQGSWPALGYAWLLSPEWVPSSLGQKGQAIVLSYATGHKVTIRGRNLRPLHERILRQQAFRVTEMGEEADQFLPEAETVVYGVVIDEPKESAGNG